MAIYHLHASTGSRKNGQSAGAKSDYIRREGSYVKVGDEVLATGDGHMPSWAAAEPRTYWQAADDHERDNGRLFKEIEFALPREMTLDQQVEAVEALASHVTDELSLPFSYAIHAGEGNNPHCHLMISERINDGHDRSPDLWFKRAATGKKKGPEDGGARKTDALKPQAWLEQTREDWARIANEALERHGHGQQIDHRSLADQGIERLPQIHIGPAAAAMAKRGIEGERTALAAGVQEANRELAEARKHLALIEQHIEEVETVIEVEAEQQREAAERAELEALAASLPDPQPQPQERPQRRQEPPKASSGPSPSVKRIDAQIDAKARELREAQQHSGEIGGRMLEIQMEARRAAEQLDSTQQAAQVAAQAVKAVQAEVDSLGGLFKRGKRREAQGRLDAAQERHRSAQEAAQAAKAHHATLNREYGQLREQAAPAGRQVEKLEGEYQRLQRQRSAQIEREQPQAPAKEQGDGMDAWSREAAQERSQAPQEDAWSRERDQGWPSRGNDGPELG